MQKLASVTFFNFIASSSGRIPALDGLRAIAIILVLIRHGATSFRDSFPNIYNNINIYISNWMLNGWVGVDLFFVLSGFLVGYHLTRSWGWGFNSRITFFGKYWLKRILRTFPLYYAVILIVIFNLVPFYDYNPGSLKGELVTHALFMQDYYGTRLLPPLWSLATEEKFYLLCPIIIWGILKVHQINKRFTLITLIILSMIPLYLRISTFSNEEYISYSMFFWNFRAPFHLAIDGLLLGIIVAYIYSFKFKCCVVKENSNGIFLLTAFVALVIMAASPWMSEKADWKLTIIILFIMPLLFSVLVFTSIFTTRKFKKILGSVTFRFFSRISYSLYLVHMLLIPLSIWLLKRLLYYGLSVSWAFICYLVIYLILSIMLSIVLHILFEKPFLALKNKVSY